MSFRGAQQGEPSRRCTGHGGSPEESITAFWALTELGDPEGAVRARPDRRNSSSSEADRPTCPLSICHAPSRCKHWWCVVRRSRNPYVCQGRRGGDSPAFCDATHYRHHARSAQCRRAEQTHDSRSRRRPSRTSGSVGARGEQSPRATRLSGGVRRPGAKLAARGSRALYHGSFDEFGGSIVVFAWSAAGVLTKTYRVTFFEEDQTLAHLSLPLVRHRSVVRGDSGTSFADSDRRPFDTARLG